MVVHDLLYSGRPVPPARSPLVGGQFAGHRRSAVGLAREDDGGAPAARAAGRGPAPDSAIEANLESLRVARLALFGSALRDDSDASDLDLVEFSSMSPSTPGRASAFSRNLRTYSRAGWTSWRSAPSETPTCAGRSKSIKKPCQARSAVL
jgi:hypothetical protein